MPKRKVRMAGYIRESDPSLADSATIESQAKAVRLYGEKEGYTYDVFRHEYKEAISAYMIPYAERPKLLELLAAAKRHEFDVLVVCEIRALARRQVEVFVIYDMLQKYGVRIETIQEKFEDSAIGRFILATRAMVAELERENTFMRCQRGRRDRVEAGNLNGHPQPSYGYVFVDTDKEAKARYDFNNKIIYVDATEEEWTEVKVVRYIFDLAVQGVSLTAIIITLNELGIPPPRKPKKHTTAHWQKGTIYRILTCRDYIGEAYANKSRTVNGKVVKVPMEEQVLLPAGVIPPIISKEVFALVQEQLEINKEESLRNNKHPHDLGILRAGYAFCGICGRRLTVRHHTKDTIHYRKPDYFCRQKSGKDDLLHNHFTAMSVHILDKVAWEKAVEVIQNPHRVREQVSQIREANVIVVTVADVEATTGNIRRQMQNLYKLAQNATDDETIETLSAMMKDLEKQKHEAQALLYDIAEDEEEQEAVEAEIVKFEQWVKNVQPFLTDPTYEPSYEEKRLAVRILGIKATVYPASGDYPFRAQVDVTVPAIVSKVKHCVTNDRRCIHNGSHPGSMCSPAFCCRRSSSAGACACPACMSQAYCFDRRNCYEPRDGAYQRAGR